MFRIRPPSRQKRSDGPRHAKRGREVDGEDRVPVRVVRVRQRRRAPEAGVVDENVDALPARGRGFDQPADRVPIGDVAGDRQGLLSGAAHLGRDALDRLAAARGQHDPGSLGAEASRDRCADAAGGAGHQCHAVASRPGTIIEVRRANRAPAASSRGPRRAGRRRPPAGAESGRPRRPSALPRRPRPPRRRRGP